MRKALRTAAVLALPTAISAVHLSDMTPRAQGLPQACNDLYTATISGCSSSDFATLQCSQSCLYSLNAMVGPIVKACGGQGVQGQNLIVAFLNGIGPQQICHNADSYTTGTTTAAQQTTAQTTTTPSIISSTTTARKPTNTDSLVVDTSSTTTETSTRSTKTTSKSRPKPTTSAEVSSSSVAQFTSTTAVAKTTTTKKTTSSATKTTTGGGSSETNFDDGSGGGSPFDTAGNMMNSASLSFPALSVVLPAAAAAIFAALR